MSYENGAVHIATDGVRQQAAALLGCDIDELLIMRSTTDAMNSLALGHSPASGQSRVDDRSRTRGGHPMLAIRGSSTRYQR